MKRDLVLASLVFFAAGCGGAATQSQPVCPIASAQPASPPAHVDDDLDAMADEALVRKLLETTSASSMGKQIADSMMDTFKKMPNLPNGFVERFKKNLDPNALIEIIVPIYLKHYDRNTIIAAIRFYRTQPGRNLLGQMPTVTAETMEAGKAWGAELAKKTMRDIGP